jgi:gliding motility-associated-like protein
VPSANGCKGGATTATVIIKPIPAAQITSDKDSLCSGLTLSLTAVSSVPGTNFSWTAVNSQGINGVSTGNTAVLTQTLASNNAGIVTYTVIPTADGCKGLSISKNIKVNPIPVANVGPDKSFCFGDSARIGSDAVAGYKYQWSPSKGLNNSTVASPISSASSTTSYHLTIISKGCESFDNVVVHVSPRFKADAGPDITICKNDAATLTVTPSNAAGYRWNNEASSSTISVSPNQTSEYIVSVSKGGCVEIDTVKVFVKDIKPAPVFIPNTFSPNNDKLNDIFKAEVIDSTIVSFDCQIFNRWGELFYEWKNQDEGWDGRYKGEIVKEDVYVYKLRIINECKKETETSGIVTVIR